MYFILITIFVKKSRVLFDKVIFKMSRKELTIEERKIIIHNQELGKSYSEIAIITIAMLITPPQSPDMNPIEHLWDQLEKRCHHISNKNQLKDLLLSEWLQISSEYTKKLVYSMPNRLNEVIRLKGYPSKY